MLQIYANIFEYIFHPTERKSVVGLGYKQMRGACSIHEKTSLFTACSIPRPFPQHLYCLNQVKNCIFTIFTMISWKSKIIH